MRRTILIAPNGNEIHLLVPETQSERAYGMKGGMTPHPYTGMLFNFDPPQTWPQMTMKGVPISLQIAMIGPDRVVHTVHDAWADSSLYSSPKLTRWVVETYGPWHLLKVGDLVGFKAL